MSDQPLQAVPEAAPTAQEVQATPAAPIEYCGNCQTPLIGDYCYRCGQSEKSMVRSLHLIGADLADLVFNVDSRIFRSMFDLYFRPGFLTTEYFAGRRVRYVSPFRMFIFASLIAFFVVQLNIDFRSVDGVLNIDQSDAAVYSDEELAKVTATAAALQDLAGTEPPPRIARIVDKANRDLEAELARARQDEEKRARAASAAAEAQQTLEAVAAQPDLPPVVGDIITQAKKGNEKAAAREAEKRKRREAAAAARGEQAQGARKKDDDVTVMFKFNVNGKPWHETDNPVDFTLLPAAADARINATLAHMRDNVESMKSERGKVGQFLANTWSVFPQTLFFMMPFFALLLKIVLIFKRRLYMEHLIVALHSHAFLFQSMLVLTLLVLIRDWLSPIVPWMGAATGYLLTVAGFWTVIYLFLMQKRVYRQGWFFGLISFGVIGTCYTILLSFGVVVAFAVALTAD